MKVIGKVIIKYTTLLIKIVVTLFCEKFMSENHQQSEIGNVTDKQVLNAHHI